MKAKLLILSFVTCLSFYSINAQTSAETSGIAIQGIARDNNNTARINETISLTFTLYYNENNTDNIVGSPTTVSLNTDGFGVFSYILDPDITTNPEFANHQVYLKIEEGSTVISNEVLKHVPYAIASNNGVPTGSIMPFMGTVAPAGWALCDGQPLPPSATDLIAMVGPNAPNLNGMFLRGTGQAPNGQNGPALLATQDDTFESHDHDLNLSTQTDGQHRHAFVVDAPCGGCGIYASAGPVPSGASISQTTGPRLGYTYSFDGAHSHNITGKTEIKGAGAQETRPVNFGINYIIKL